MRHDVVIVGGALAGASLAVALRASRLQVALVEARLFRRPAGWDQRIYAVSPANVAFLSEIGVWQHLDPARLQPVRAMEVHGDRGGRIDFSAYAAGVPELAWIAESGSLQAELLASARRQADLDWLCPASPQALALEPDAARLTLADGRMLEAALIVAADGADSWVRQAAGLAAATVPYGQSGVVANFRCAQPHRDTAYQWFRADGVLAYLPLPDNQISIVWSTPQAHAEELLALDHQEFAARVAAASGHRLGALEMVTPPAAFPLRLMRVPQVVAPRLALIGDAAHAIHPLSGHGINLGFQDARVLAEVLRELPEFRDCGELPVLRRYARARAEEVRLVQATADGLQHLFAPQNTPLALLRNLGLNLTNRLPVVRNLLVRYALG